MAGVTAPDGGVKRVIDGRPEAIRRNCEDSLRRLQTDVIDLYYLHRWDKAVPIEDSVGAMADLVRAGKVRAIGLSEVSAAHAAQGPRRAPDRRAADRVFAVDAQPRDRGAAGLPRHRRGLRRLQPGGARLPHQRAARRGGAGCERHPPQHAALRAAAYAPNLRLLDGYNAIAAEAGCTPAQLSLAWLLARGEHVVPIPGTTSPAHLRENIAAADVQLAPEIVARVDALINQRTVCGERYGAQSAVRGRYRGVLSLLPRPVTLFRLVQQRAASFIAHTDRCSRSSGVAYGWKTGAGLIRPSAMPTLTRRVPCGHCRRPPASSAQTSLTASVATQPPSTPPGSIWPTSSPTSARSAGRACRSSPAAVRRCAVRSSARLSISCGSRCEVEQLDVVQLEQRLHRVGRLCCFGEK